LGFAIIGDGAERQRLETLCRQQGLDPWVTFTGRIDKSLVPTALASSDVLLVHLKKNKLFESAIPSKIFEAMAADKPLLVGVQGEVTQIVNRAGCGLMFEPENARDLADQLRSLADDPQRYAALSHSGRQFVATHYSRDSLANAMLHSVQAAVPSATP
jgi:glycosyltransferase involved in cell wall biosynthesis